MRIIPNWIKGFTLTCSNAGGSNSDTVVVDVPRAGEQYIDVKVKVIADPDIHTRNLGQTCEYSPAWGCLTNQNQCRWMYDCQVIQPIPEEPNSAYIPTCTTASDTLNQQCFYTDLPSHSETPVPNARVGVQCVHICNREGPEWLQYLHVKRWTRYSAAFLQRLPLL